MGISWWWRGQLLILKFQSWIRYEGISWWIKHMWKCSINRSNNGDRRITVMGHIQVQRSQVHISLTISSLLSWPRGRTQIVLYGKDRLRSAFKPFTQLLYSYHFWQTEGSSFVYLVPLKNGTPYTKRRCLERYSKNVHDHKLRCSNYGGYKKCFSLFEYDSCQRQHCC